MTSSPETIEFIVEALVIALDEPSCNIKNVQRMVQKYGIDKSIAAYKTALMIHRNGGEIIADGSRSRTLAGLWWKEMKNDSI